VVLILGTKTKVSSHSVPDGTYIINTVLVGRQTKLAYLLPQVRFSEELDFGDVL
jgi:hypothetical protein